MKNKYSNNNHLKGVIILLVVTAIWGSGFVASDIVIREAGVMPMITLRFFIGFLVLLVISNKSVLKMQKPVIKKGFMLGALGFLAFFFQAYGLKYTTPSKNAFVTATNVIIVPFIGMFILGNQVKKKNIFGAFITLIGISLLTLNSDFTVGKGDMLTFIGAVLFAFHIVGIGELGRSENAAHLSLVQMITSCSLGFIVTLFIGFNLDALSTTGVIAVIYLGIFPTGLAYLMQTWAQKYTTETEAAIILSFESVFGTLLSILILGETLSPRMIIGSVLIMLSIFISELNFAKIFRRE